MKKRIIIVSLLGIFTSLVYAKTIAIGTNPQGSLAYATGSAIAKVIIEKNNLQMRVVPQGGPSVTVPLVNSGELQFSVTNAVAAVLADKGEVIFKKPNPNLRVVGILFPFGVGFIVPNKSDIQNIQDLKGKRLPSVFVKQKIVLITMDAVLHAAGISKNEVRNFPVPDGIRAIEDLETGKLDTAFFALSSARTRQANAIISGGIRILPIEKSLEKKINEKTPGVWIRNIKPSPPFPGVKKEQGALFMTFALMASTHTPDDIVYKVVKTIYNNKKALASSFAPFNGFNEKAMNENLGLKLHPAAIKFYKEVGLY